MHATVVVPADHPCLAGHFPGRPIVPGVLLLERAMAAAARAGPDLRIAGVSEAKFVRPALPDQRLEIRIDLPRPGRVAFEITGEAGVLVRGRLILEPGA